MITSPYSGIPAAVQQISSYHYTFSWKGLQSFVTLSKMKATTWSQEVICFLSTRIQPTAQQQERWSLTHVHQAMDPKFIDWQQPYHLQYTPTELWSLMTPSSGTYSHLLIIYFNYLTTVCYVVSMWRFLKLLGNASTSHLELIALRYVEQIQMSTELSFLNRSFLLLTKLWSIDHSYAFSFQSKQWSSIQFINKHR